MKLINTKAEITLLRTICMGGKSSMPGKMLAALRNDHFGDETANKVFKIIKKIVRKDGEIPTWEDLQLRNLLSDSVKKELRAYKKLKPIKDENRCKELFQSVESLRKGRVLYENADNTLKQLTEDVVDIDDIYQSSVENLNEKQRSTLNEDEIVVLGKPSKASKSLVDELLSTKDRGIVIPTGFASFDSENGGMFEAGLTTIASTSGGGKSVMATQLSKNMAEYGYKCAVIPLEMTRTEMGARYMSNISRIDVRKFIGAQPLTEKESKHARKAYKKWEEELKSNGGRIRIFSPEEDMTIEELLAFLLPYNDDVIFIDYIGLLGGVDGDDQWQKLSQVARYAKRWGTRHNKRVVLFAQLSEEGQIRYSKAIKDHSDLMWCVPGFTYISTPDGLRRMDSIANGLHTQKDTDIPVISQGQENKSVNFINQGVKPVIQVHTSTSSIACTENEKMKVLNDKLEYDWIEAKDLLPEDVVVRSSLCVPKESKVSIPNYSDILPPEMNEDLVKLCGFYYTGGLVYKDVAYTKAMKHCGRYVKDLFVNTKGYRVDELKGLISKLFNVEIPEDFEYKLFRLPAKVQKYLGQLLACIKEDIPDCIMRCGTDLMKVYLDFISEYIVKKDRGVNRVTTLKLRMLINSCGYYTLSSITKWNSKDISNSHPVMDNICQGITTDNSYKVTKFIYNNIQHISTRYRQLIETHGLGVINSHIEKVKEYPSIYKLLLDIRDKKYYYENFVSSNSYKDMEVYDLSIPDTNEYIAQGFAIHNCWVFTEKNREAGEIYIVQQKARNQKQFDFTLGIDFAHMRMFDPETETYTPKKVKKISKFKKGLKKIERDIKKSDKKKLKRI